MKALTAALIVFGVILFFMYLKTQNQVPWGTSKVSYFEAVDPTLIQNTITQIQEKNNTLYPLTTVYFNKEGDGYAGRMIFLDSKNYKGVQYDVTVGMDGKLLSTSTGVPSSFQNPFSGLVKKFGFGNLNVVPPVPDMGSIWNKYAIV
jgi:hypothetical protein